MQSAPRLPNATDTAHTAHPHFPPSAGQRDLHDEIRELLTAADNMHAGLTHEEKEGLFLHHLQHFVRKYPAGEIREAFNFPYFSQDRLPTSLPGKAAALGFAKVLRFVIDQGVDLAGNEPVLEDVLEVALSSRHGKDILHVLKSVPNLNWNLPLSLYCGRTLLGAHVGTDSRGAVQELLAIAELDPNSTGSFSRTPLGQAVAMFNTAMVELLLANPRVDVNQTDAKKRSAVEVALQRASRYPGIGHQYHDMVSILIKHPGFDPFTPLSDGRSLLAYARQNQLPGIVDRISALAYRQQVSCAQRTVEAAAKRLGSESIHYKRLQALDIRSRQYCAHLLEPVLQQQAAAIKEQPNMTKEQLDTLEADFSTAVSAALDKLSAMQADKLNDDVARRLTKGSALRTLLEQLTPTQRLDAACLLTEGLSGKSPREINTSQLESMVHKALDTLRHAEKRDAGTEQRIDLPLQDHWPDLP